eukprot:CAMPEP_0119076214 /NCGR_PEP_ID=MMETSP1178-20130426/85044_1 /TAXON_ID=33656 /ORGANISM="unid sp, Strain CCMP2000" /LENGTH=111 /DNA_ID=CAMNT_0007058479 /DNA_START=20 /DNA_END=354 /DNA_ORIENTATION=-
MKPLIACVILSCATTPSAAFLSFRLALYFLGSSPSPEAGSSWQHCAICATAPEQLLPRVRIQLQQLADEVFGLRRQLVPPWGGEREATQQDLLEECGQLLLVKGREAAEQD